MRLITWNINSIRLRMGLLEQVTRFYQPDVVALQETKVDDENFPLKNVQDLGYAYCSFRGEKSYNGVAILSKIPFLEHEKHNFVEKNDSRHISVHFENGVQLHNFYVPAGGDIPDYHTNEKFAHKLDFIREMKDYLHAILQKNHRVIICGDFNIAPMEHDVWSHKQLAQVVSHTAIEIDLLNQLKESCCFIDTARMFADEKEKIYSWWSYRNKDWKKSNRGRRLDHIWVSDSLKDTLKDIEHKSEMRDWEKPSDHVAVIGNFDIS